MVDPKAFDGWHPSAYRAELSRLTAENASLRLVVEGARNVLTNLKSWFCHRELENGDCSSLCELCRIERTLAILPAPGEPGKLMEALREVVRLQQAIDAEHGEASIELENELRDKVVALCALVPEGK